MASGLDGFTPGPSDWRKALKINNRKTLMVIAVFFLIYVSIGLLMDCALASSKYPSARLEELITALLEFQIFPLATLIMVAVAAVSLFVTFAFHDSIMLLGTEYHEINPENPLTSEEKQLYNIIEEIKIAAGLSYMPRVFIIEADYMNAFASGYSEKSAMVAITKGLLTKLNRSETAAVMAHEISHIRHMDIKLTLMASVLANLMTIVLDIIFYNMLFSREDSDNRSRNSLAMIFIVLRYVLPIINVLLLLYLSRTREYMADAGCVELMRDNQALATALLKIQGDYTDNQTHYKNETQSAHENVRREAYIFDPTQAGISSVGSIADMFSTHPNIADRLAALGFKSKTNG
jgi:heat shock protein HtpX